ncbi:MAG: cytochrome oxidase assembly protein [Candidatus Oxydemutatoraceae bacterium WSBS_2016_MAG_OTU14]
MTSSRIKLVGLFLAFFGPMFIATLLYFNVDAPRFLSNNHGQLLDPIKTLPPLEASDLQRKELLPRDFLLGKWTLLFWGSSHCDLACEASLFKMRQVRLSLGREIERVQTLYLLNKGKISPQLQALLKRHPRLTIAEPKDASPFLLELNAQSQQHVFVIDTHGNLIMEYTRDATSKGMFTDLKHLLRTSKIG